jgi:hypothetical protein
MMDNLTQAMVELRDSINHEYQNEINIVLLQNKHHKWVASISIYDDDNSKFVYLGRLPLPVNKQDVLKFVAKGGNKEDGYRTTVAECEQYMRDHPECKTGMGAARRIKAARRIAQVKGE